MAFEGLEFQSVDAINHLIFLIVESVRVCAGLNGSEQGSTGLNGSERI